MSAASQTLTPEQLRFVVKAAHHEWWLREMQPRLDRAYGGKGKVPESIQQGLYDASAAGFQAGYSMGYDAAERDRAVGAAPATLAPPSAG